MKTKSKKSLCNRIIPIVTMVMFAVIAVWAVIAGKFLEPGFEMGYMLFFFYFLIPFAAFIGSAILGAGEAGIKWLAPFIFAIVTPGILFMAFDSTDMIFVIITLVPGLVGLAIGIAIRAVRRK